VALFFSRPVEASTFFRFVRWFTYFGSRMLNGFDCWSHRLFDPPRSFLYWRVSMVRFTALRALPRAVAAFLFCALDCFLRLAMIAPCSGRCSATHYAADANVRIYVADQIAMMLHRSSGENRCRPWSKQTAANWPL
jgi:hypothetical protein